MEQLYINQKTDLMESALKFIAEPGLNT